MVIFSYIVLPLDDKRLFYKSAVKTFKASFTKQRKLAWERNSKTVQMGVEISMGDLLTMHKLKNTDATSNLHINQRNTPSAAHISVVANKE